MGTRQSKAKERGSPGPQKENSASPEKNKASPQKEKSASPKKEKRKSRDIAEKQEETTPSQQNGNSSAAPDEGAVTRRNGTAEDKKIKKRISFYETVDASEVLPYLIIGEHALCCSVLFTSPLVDLL